MPWRRECPPTRVFWPVESQGHRSLVGYRPWGHKESDMPEWLTLSLLKQYMERKQFWWINHLLPQILKHKFGSSGNYCLVSQILSAHINNWKCPHHKEFLLSSSRISPSSDENRYFRGKKKKKKTLSHLFKPNTSKFLCFQLHPSTGILLDARCSRINPFTRLISLASFAKLLKKCRLLPCRRHQS